MAETDYNEILLEAIDAIVVSRISEVNFDRTIVATIVDASKAKDGEYVLSDGSVQFTAHSGNDKYKENDRVNVLIPSNDFSSTEKTILGKTSANINDVPVTYVSPLEKIVPMETNYAAGLKGGITANSETKIFQLTNAEWIEVNESTLGYDTLCISARFKTLLNDYDIRQGHYGLLVQLQTKNGYEHILTLDSAKDMFGNPYGYSMYLTQEQTYHLNLQDNIIGIKIDLYQMKDFKYNDGVNSELQVLPVMPYSNILVDNINVSFGYNAEQVEDNTVKIDTADSLTYNNIKDVSVTKKLTLTWYNKDENNKYLGFADGAFSDLSAAQTSGSQKYYIKWEHSLNNGQWEEIQETGQEQELTVNLNMAWGLNEYRVIVVFDGASYISNIIQFKNATGIDNPQEKLQMLLTLHNVVDSSYDSYPLYGSDGVVINPLDATQNRKVYFSYSSEIGGSLEPDVLKGATAYFYIPQNSTMLTVPGEDTNWDDDQDGDHRKTGYVAYVKRFSKEQTEPTVEEKTFSYRIKANYNPLFTNNKVILRIVDKNGFIYETSKTFAFSSYGTSGTDYSIIISGADGENGWVGSNGFTPKAQLYDANYKEITDVDWTWSKYPTGTTISANQSLSSTTTLYQAIKAQTTVSWVGKNVQISGIYPIPYSADEDYMYQGPTTIIYNSNGVKPSYYNGDLGIFKKSDNSEVTCTWSIEYFTKSNANVSGDEEPWLSWGELTETKDGHTRFKPSSMYLGDTYYLVLVAKNEATILWRQPLIILQNQYASGLLNNWDGNLIVDNEGNYVLSSMMGAGSKDNQNRFNGILMGEVSKVANTSAETGLFGYHEGAQSFGFKTDGTAFIGKRGAGRIEFKGSSGIIKSADNKGMSINLSTGNITATNFNLSAKNNNFILSSNSSPYVKIYKDANNYLEYGDSGLKIKIPEADLIIGNETVGAKITASKEGIMTEVGETLKGYSTLKQTSDAINASVSKKLDTEGKGASFGWSLTSSGFYIDDSTNPSADNYVLSVDSNGLKVNGIVTATSGKIGGWSLSPLKNSSGTIYGYSLTSGTEGTKGFIGLWTAYPTSANYRMRIGTKFSIDDDGILDASGAIISGNITATSGTFNGNIAAKTLSLANAQPASDLSPYSIGKVLDATSLKAQVSRSPISDNGKVTFTATLDTAPAVKCTGYMSVTYNDLKEGVTTTTLVFNFIPLSRTATAALNNVRSIAVAAASIDITINKPGIAIQASLVPADKDKEYTLGSASLPWACVYAKNNTIQSSDERLKNLSELTSREENFFNNIHPLKYLWKQGDKQYHFGFGAQSVQESLEQSGLNVNEYFIVQQGETMNLCYSEFIALNTWQIQKLKQRVSELEAQLSKR